MKIKGTFVIRRVMDENLLIPTGDTALKINGMITIDDVGMVIWNGIEAGKRKDEILDEILTIYEVEKDEAEADLEDFINHMLEADLLEL